METLSTASVPELLSSFTDSVANIPQQLLCRIPEQLLSCSGMLQTAGSGAAVTDRSP